MLTRALIASLAACSIGACSAGGSQLPATGNAASLLHAAVTKVTAVKFKWVITLFGNTGQQVRANCGSWVLVGGGGGSNDGSQVYGFPNTTLNSWYVKPGSGSKARAYASCAAPSVLASHTIEWSQLQPAVNNQASVACRPGYVPISGAAVIPSGAVGERITHSFVDVASHAFVVSGGASAIISCGREAAGITLSNPHQVDNNPVNVFQSCASNQTVIGGLSGDGNYPQPAYQEHPGDAGQPGNAGFAGWWIQVAPGDPGAVSWAACVPTT